MAKAQVMATAMLQQESDDYAVIVIIIIIIIIIMETSFHFQNFTTYNHKPHYL